MNVDRLNAETQERISEAALLAHQYAEATGVECALLDRHGVVRYPVQTRAYPCWVCRLSHGSLPDSDRLGREHLAWAEQAKRFGGRQVFLCPSALLHWVVPLTDDGGDTVGALVGGPVRTIEEDSFFADEILRPLREVSPEVARVEEASLRAMFDRIPVVTSSRVQSLTEQLYRAALSLRSGINEQSRSGSERLLRESRINEYIQELKRYRSEAGLDPERPTYPLDKEQRLLDAIANGEVENAQAALNELLGHVFFTLGADLERIRNRAREIVVLLSRISITKGADADRVFGLNYQFLDELDELEDINEIAHWMARIVRRFASSVLTVPGGAIHVVALRRVIEYVQQSYRGSVTLTEAATAAGLSPTYLSQIFSSEMGEPFSRFVQRVRVNRVRELLLSTSLGLSDIAELCGFSDQSHMTRVFREVTGTTPALFRRKRRQI
ncbi:MAG: helix-turn-helix domain-containing protein [Spirochaetaceae bacterium]